MTSFTGSAQRIWGIWRKSRVLRLDTGREGLTLLCSRRPLWRVPHEMVGRWKSQHRKIVPLSLEKTLNSKVIKFSYLNKEVVSVFRVSRFLCSILYIYIYEHYMFISHIAISGYGTGLPFVVYWVSQHSWLNTYPNSSCLYYYHKDMMTELILLIVPSHIVSIDHRCL